MRTLKKAVFTKEELGELYNATVGLRQFVEGYTRERAKTLHIEEIPKARADLDRLAEDIDRVEKLKRLTNKIHKLLFPTVRSRA